MQVTIDARTGERVTSEEPGTVGFVGWTRLGSVLRDAGEIRQYEEVLSFRIDEHGIHVRVKDHRR